MRHLTRPIPMFRHVCLTCPDCPGADPDCPTCWGESDATPCRCEEFYERAVNLRIDEAMGK